MDIKWMQDFLSLARTHSFSRAAEERHITQPALSRRIRALEEWVGVELVDRSTQPLRLTAAGKHYQRHVEEVLHALLETRASLRRMQERAMFSNDRDPPATQEQCSISA